MWPLVLLRSAFQPSMIWGNHRLVSLLPVCANLWIGLTSTKGLKKTNYRGREMLRWSFRRGGISGWTGTIITDLRKTLLGSQDLPIPMWLMLYSENKYNRFWRRLRMSCSSNGRTRWQEILWGVIRAFIANIIRTMDTLSRIVKTCGTNYINWPRKRN